jgi:YVTN family beta-propeller protein
MSVVDVATQTLTATVNVGTYLRGVAVSPDGTRVYVANLGPFTVGSGYVASNVTVINTANNTVSATIAVGSSPSAITFAPNGTYAYVANSGQYTVSVIDTNPASLGYNNVVGTITVPGNPKGVAFSPDGTKAYVTSFSGYGNWVSVIDTATNTETARINSVGSSPVGIAVTPDGSAIYVANSAADIKPNPYPITVISAATNTITVTFAAPKGPAALAFTPDSTLYINNTSSGGVSVVAPVFVARNG